MNEDHGSRFGFSNPGRLLFLTLAFAAMTGAGVWVVHSEFAQRAVSFDSRLLHPRVLAAAGALLFSYFVADGLRLHYTLRALGHAVPFRTALNLVFINHLVSNVTPMATGGGIAQVVYLRSQGVPIGSATAATTIRTVLAVLFIFSSVPLVLWLLAPGGDDGFGASVAGYLAVAVAVYLGSFGLALGRPRWLAGPLTTLVRSVGSFGLVQPERAERWEFKVRRELVRFGRSVRAYGSGSRTDVALSVFWTAVFLISLFSFPAVLLAGLGYGIPYPTVVGLTLLTTFVLYFSPTPGASGIAEGTFGYLFRDLVAAEHLVLLTVSWRVLSIYVGMGLGLIVLQRALVRRTSFSTPDPQ